MYMVVVACAGVAHTGSYSREKQLYSPVLQPVTLKGLAPDFGGLQPMIFAVTTHQVTLHCCVIVTKEQLT
jgi:hypothetical protein